MHQALHPQAFLLELVGRWAKCKAPTAPLPSPEAHAWCACWACSVDCTWGNLWQAPCHLWCTQWPQHWSNKICTTTICTFATCHFGCGCRTCTSPLGHPNVSSGGNASTPLGDQGVEACALVANLCTSKVCRGTCTCCTNGLASCHGCSCSRGGLLC